MVNYKQVPMKTNEKPIQKAYEIDLDRISEGYLYSNYICHADNKSQAKSALLKQSQYDDLKLRITEEPVTYLTLPVVRIKSFDKYMYKGELMTQENIIRLEAMDEHNARLQSVLDDNQVTHCHISKRSYYYRDGYCGYTEDINKAGVYPKADAVEHCKNSTELCMIPIDAQEHNERINKAIEEMQARMLMENVT